MAIELDKIRREYLRDGLRREDLPEDPVDFFRKWQQQIIECQLIDPTAMVLATAGPDGQPSQRIVLLKHFDERGFVFYTNYGSRKAREIAANSRVSLLFPWHPVERQVKICGTAGKLGLGESARYFASRPRDSQLAAWASKQSAAIEGRSFLLGQMARMKEKFSGGEVPLPDFWGGIRVQPHEMEFWQGGGSRLHDRFRYTLQADGSWRLDRLAP